MKSICIVFNKSPYGSHSSRELLDIALMSAAFDMPIKAIFMADGVLQLLKDQQPEIMDIKNHSMTFKALDLYGIEEVYFEQEALAQRNISEQDLLPIAQAIPNNSIAEQLSSSDFVVML